jgi:hypothetical protein
MLRIGFAGSALAFWLTTAFVTIAQAQSNGIAIGSGGGGGPGTDGGTMATSGSAPEFDGPAGVAAIALLACAAMIAYRRFARK